MVTVKSWRGETSYPEGMSVRYPRKEPWVLRVLDKDGKVIGAHRDWDSVSTDATMFTTKDAYMAALVETLKARTA